VQAHEQDNFGELVTSALAYYRQDCTPFTLAVWWEGCKPFSLEQVSKALTAHATDADRGQYAPKVADIVRILGGTSTDRAAMAWGKVYDAMCGIGAYTDVVFDDPAIHATVNDMGGWPKMCRTSMDDLSYLQHRFCESYRAYSGRQGFDYPRVLGGERSPDELYAKRGLPPPKPAVVGDVERARLVYKGGASKAIGMKILERIAA
jgi:hypothetical protein